MRIAIAGGGGLGFLLARHLARAQTAHNVLVLSRTERPEFESFDIQVYKVNYYSQESLRYALQGADLVISTVSGMEQINLIMAAAEGTVRHFVPAEFQGPLARRIPAIGPSDSSSLQAMALLLTCEGQGLLRHTVFSCGIFMEAFHPLGLDNFGIGHRSGTSQVGSYFLDINAATAEYVENDHQGQAAQACLTSIYDLARFIVSALDLGPETWPREFTLSGDRLPIRDIVQACSVARRTNNHRRYAVATFGHIIRDIAEIRIFIDYYKSFGDVTKCKYYERLLAAAHGQYDFAEATLIGALSDRKLMNFTPLTFSNCMERIIRLSA